MKVLKKYPGMCIIVFTSLVLASCVPSSSPWKKIIGGDDEATKPQEEKSVDSYPLEKRKARQFYPESGDVGVAEKSTMGGFSEEESGTGVAAAQSIQTYEDEPGAKELAGAGQDISAFKIDPTFIKGRLGLYEQKMAGWNKVAGGIISLDMGAEWPTGWHSCVQDLEMIIFGYRRLLEEVGTTSSIQRGRRVVDPWSLLERDVRYVEGGCGEILDNSASGVRSAVSEYSSAAATAAAAMFRQYIESGQYSQAVDAYAVLESADQGELPVAIKKDYSLALRRTGDLRQAAQVMADISDGNRAAMAGLDLRAEIENADLLLASGQFDAARDVYGRLAGFMTSIEDQQDWVGKQLAILADIQNPNMSLYRDLLGTYYRSDGRRVPAELYSGMAIIDQDGESDMLSSVRTVLQKSEEGAGKWTEQQLAHVRDLLLDKEFVQADLLVEELIAGAPADRKESLLLVKDEIELAAARDREVKRQLLAQQNLGQWEQATELYGQKEYDAAIAVFRSLLGSEYEVEAKKKLIEAANQAAATLRRQAASLFARARKIMDQEAKLQALIQSRDLLLELVKKYPDSDLIEKVERNLQVLDNEINKFDSN